LLPSIGNASWLWREPLSSPHSSA